jgi:arylsulfatase
MTSRRLSILWAAATLPMIIAAGIGPAAAQDRSRQVLGISARDSTQYFEAEPMPPARAPNVVLIVLDDVGFSDLGAFGSEIRTPYIDALAAGGLAYANFHNQAICSPTRAALLTGRNPHSVGVATVPGLNNGFPHGQARLAPNAATLAQVLQGSGYRTFAVGKWHLSATMQTSSRAQWPLAHGFDQFYGFLGAMTDQYRPELVRDNSLIEAPRDPGYHLSADLVDQAIGYVANESAVSPERPFFLYLAFGAVHSPHQVPRRYVDPYLDLFAKGWDRTRADRFAAQQRLGIIAAGTALPPADPKVAAWDSLAERERQVFTEFQATYAGFITHTDEQIGRLLAALDRMGRRDDTLVILLSDNGASGSGYDIGTLNDMRALTLRDSGIDELAAMRGRFGGPDTFQNYPRGWAQAGNTPFRSYKGTAYEGGSRSPLIVSWPKGIAAHGAVRGQYVNTIDVMPTVLELAGIAMPDSVDGIAQLPIAGRSFSASFANAAAKPPRDTQYFELIGQRALWHRGWKAIGAHRAGTGFEADRWELYDLNSDPTETRDLAAAESARLEEMKARWWAEAGRYGVTPLTEVPLAEIMNSRPDSKGGPYYKFVRDQRTSYNYYPESGPLLRQEAPNLLSTDYSAVARVRPLSGAEQGVLFAFGDQFGGYSLYVEDGSLVFAFNDLGAISTIRAPAGKLAGANSLGIAFHRTGPAGGIGRLMIDGRQVAAGPIASADSPLSGLSNLDIGRDGGGAVVPTYRDRGDFAFAPGMILRVDFTLSPIVSAKEPQSR